MIIRWSARLQVIPAAVLLALAGCSSSEPAPVTPAAPAATSAAAAATGAATAASPTDDSEAGRGSAEGLLAPPERATTAFTYNPALAPEGAEVSVEVRGEGGGTAVDLEVSGLLPDRGYAAHAHVNPCGATGDAAGPHFQNSVDPAAAPGKPSTDPAYANPQNEIWLDLRTDGDGDGESTAQVPFVFADRAPASVVIHEAEATATEPGRAGSAGARLACLSVPLA
jgi:superoxide dismutase, Cu-Zn family